MKLRSWKVLGGEGAPGSESLQKKMRGGLWPCSLIPLLNFHKQMLPSRSPPWKPHSASGERKGRGPCQQVSSALHWSPQPYLWHPALLSTLSISLIFFLPLLHPFSSPFNPKVGDWKLVACPLWRSQQWPWGCPLHFSRILRVTGG